MALETIIGKMKSDQYRNKEQFKKDVELIFSNCQQFNEEGTEITNGWDGFNMLVEYEYDSLQAMYAGASDEEKSALAEIFGDDINVFESKEEAKRWVDDFEDTKEDLDEKFVVIKSFLSR